MWPPRRAHWLTPALILGGFAVFALAVTRVIDVRFTAAGFALMLIGAGIGFAVATRDSGDFVRTVAAYWAAVDFALAGRDRGLDPEAIAADPAGRRRALLWTAWAVAFLAAVIWLLIRMPEDGSGDPAAQTLTALLAVGWLVALQGRMGWRWFGAWLAGLAVSAVVATQWRPALLALLGLIVVALVLVPGSFGVRLLLRLPPRQPRVRA